MLSKDSGGIKIRKENWLPTMDDSYEDVMKSYCDKVETLADDLLRTLALAQPNCQWISKINSNRYIGLHLLAYHPGPTPCKTTRKHTDASWITLLQEDDVGGLKLLAKRPIERWISVKPRIGAFVCNAGNILERESQGYYSAVCHHPNVLQIARHLFVYFFIVKSEGICGVYKKPKGITQNQFFI